MSLKPTSAVKYIPCRRVRRESRQARGTRRQTQSRRRPATASPAATPPGQLLDALSGNKDPGMFGRMFPTLPPLEVSDAKLQALADAMIDTNAGSRRQQRQYPGRLHLFRPVRRPRHHARSDLARRQGKGSARHRELPHAELRPRLRLRPRPGRQPASLCAQPGDGNKHGPKLLIGKNLRHRRRRLPQRPAAQPGRLCADRRPPQRREPAGRADPSGLAEVPQRGLRHAVGGANPPADIFKEARQIVTWHYQWIVLHDWVERLTEQGHGRQDPQGWAQVLSVQESALHAGRVFGRRLPPRPLHGAPALSAQQGVQHAAGFRACSSRSPACPATSSATLRPGRRQASRRCPATGSSTGGASMSSATAAARRSP